MKSNVRYIVCLASLLAAYGLKPNTLAAGSSQQSALSLGVRHHQEHSAYTELPFDDGDYSYGIAYEYHENAAYWQLAVDAAFDVSGTNTVSTEFDYVLTPQLNLIFKDDIWRGGVGALASYMVDKNTDDGEWTDVYWQFLLGVSIPLGRLELDILAAYPFESWGDLGDFEASDIDAVGWLRYSF